MKNILLLFLVINGTMMMLVNNPALAEELLENDSRPSRVTVSQGGEYLYLAVNNWDPMRYDIIELHIETKDVRSILSESKRLVDTSFPMLLTEEGKLIYSSLSADRIDAQYVICVTEVGNPEVVYVPVKGNASYQYPQVGTGVIYVHRRRLFDSGLEYDLAKIVPETGHVEPIPGTEGLLRTGFVSVNSGLICSLPAREDREGGVFLIRHSAAEQKLLLPGSAAIHWQTNSSRTPAVGLERLGKLARMVRVTEHREHINVSSIDVNAEECDSVSFDVADNGDIFLFRDREIVHIDSEDKSVVLTTEPYPIDDFAIISESSGAYIASSEDSEGNTQWYFGLLTNLNGTQKIQRELYCFDGLSLHKVDNSD